MDFDADFNLTDMAGISNKAQTKGIGKILKDKDSLVHVYDSIGKAYYKDAQALYYPIQRLKPKEYAAVKKRVADKDFNIDSIYNKLRPDERRMIVDRALSDVQQEISDLDFKSMITKDGDNLIRQHEIEIINKYLLALTCIIFFFIGAPLGAIIRKGGLGVPIIISVLVFIIYYILQNTGYRMARAGDWAIWFGESLSPAVLIPTAIFITYKSNNDSAVFNIDMYRNMFMRILGLRIRRHISSKEVIIHTPDYAKDADILSNMSESLVEYARKTNLKSPPNIIRTFFVFQPDHEIENISKQLEEVIEDLANTRNKAIMSELNRYPILITKAHTRPFEKRWMNIVAAVIIPAGLFFYFRMWRFRLRLYRDLKVIKDVNENIIREIRDNFSSERS